MKKITLYLLAAFSASISSTILRAMQFSGGTVAISPRERDELDVLDMPLEELAARMRQGPRLAQNSGSLLGLMEEIHYSKNYDKEAYPDALNRFRDYVRDMDNATVGEIRAQDRNGNSSLHEAARLGDKDVLEVLIEKLRSEKVDPFDFLSQKNKKGQSVLHVAAFFGNAIIVEFILTLFKSSAATASYWEIRDNEGMTPLNIAAANGCDEVVELLIKNKADPCTKDKNGSTPILNAARNGYFNSFELLLENAPECLDINKPDFGDGNTLLHYSVEGPYEDIIVRLLDMQADPLLKNNDGLNPLDYAEYLEERERDSEKKAFRAQRVFFLKQRGLQRG